MMCSLSSRRTNHQHWSKLKVHVHPFMHLEPCTNGAWVCWLSTTIGHSVNSVQQTSQQQEEPQVQVLSYTQKVQEEITDSDVSFNTSPAGRALPRRKGPLPLDRHPPDGNFEQVRFYPLWHFAFLWPKPTFPRVSSVFLVPNWPNLYPLWHFGLFFLAPPSFVPYDLPQCQLQSWTLKLKTWNPITSAGPPPAQNFALFFSFSRPLIFIYFFLSLGRSSRVFFSLSLSGCLLVSFFLSVEVFSWNFGGVLVGRDLRWACFRLRAVLWNDSPAFGPPAFGPPPFRLPRPSCPQPFTPPSSPHSLPPPHPRKCPKLTVAKVGKTVVKVGPLPQSLIVSLRKSPRGCWFVKPPFTGSSPLRNCNVCVRDGWCAQKENFAFRNCSASINWGWPDGAPKILMPCLSQGRSKPRHTRHRGLTCEQWPPTCRRTLVCAAFPVVCPAFAAAFGSLTAEKPTLAAFDLPKCQAKFYNWSAPHWPRKKSATNC